MANWLMFFGKEKKWKTATIVLATVAAALVVALLVVTL